LDRAGTARFDFRDGQIALGSFPSLCGLHRENAAACHPAVVSDQLAKNHPAVESALSSEKAQVDANYQPKEKSNAAT